MPKHLSFFMTLATGSFACAHTAAATGSRARFGATTRLAARAGKQRVTHASEHIQPTANALAKAANYALQTFANILHAIVAATRGFAAAAGTRATGTGTVAARAIAAARAATGNIHHRKNSFHGYVHAIICGRG